jgi:hypothetical protein
MAVALKNGAPRYQHFAGAETPTLNLSDASLNPYTPRPAAPCPLKITPDTASKLLD